MPTAQSMKSKYRVLCPVCKRELATTYLPGCPEHVALPQVEYRAAFPDEGGRTGAARFLDWLPCETLADMPGPLTRLSPELGAVLGLKRLAVSFNGYWPERGAGCRSATFKEYEAQVTLARLKEFGGRHLVLASAGNTGRAFARHFQGSGLCLILVVPQGSEADIWLDQPADRDLVLLSVRGGDYLDAIQMADRICAVTGLPAEGGARSIARRAGLAMPVLDAVLKLGEIPAHYVQAVGSGTGGIAAYEAASRFAASGRLSPKTMRLHLAQNQPFVPMVSAYRRGSRTLDPVADTGDAAATASTWARMLTNRRPPYGLPGGVFDVLQASGGQMWAVDQVAACAAQRLFRDIEGIDISPEAAVAVAALQQAVAKGCIPANDLVLLNITGGGAERVCSERTRYRPEARLIERMVPDAELKALALGEQA